MERVYQCSEKVWDEVTFWVEVIGEFLGWNKSPYQWILDQHENDIREAQREYQIKQRRLMYTKKD